MTKKNPKRELSRRKPGRPAANDANRRMELIDSALELFARSGVAATSFKSVARTVRVTSALVHYYFKNREELIKAVADQRVTPVMQALWEPLSNKNIDCRTLILQLADNMAKAAFSLPWFAPLWLREFSSAKGELLLRASSATRHQYPDRFIRRVRAAQRKGEIHASIDPKMLYAMIVGMTLIPAAAVFSCPDFNKRRGKLERGCYANLDWILQHGIGAQPT